MTTDTAELQETQTGQQPASEPSAEAEKQVIASDQPPAEGAASAEAAGQSESEAKEGSSPAEDEYSLDAILKEAGIESASPDDKPLPGKTAAQIEEEQRQAAWQNLQTFRNQTLRDAEGEWNAYADEQGLTPAEKAKSWQWIRGLVNQVDQTHTNAKLQPFNQIAKLDIIKEQDPEAHAIFAEREYDGVVNTMAGLMASGRKAEQERLKKLGIPTTKETLDKVTKLAYSKGMSAGEKNASSANSGRNNDVNGGGPVTQANPDDVLDDPNASKEAKDRAFEQKHGFKPPSN